MKKTLIVVVALAAIVLVTRPFFCKSDKKSTDQAENAADVKQQPLSVSQNTDVFNQSFTHLLNAYNDLKNTLVASDAPKASAAAQVLRTAADSLKVNEIKGDSTGSIKETAASFSSTIAGSAQALAAEKDIKGQRKEFEQIADAMWNLTRTVRYTGQKLYWQFCPMAFDNKGAYWISYEREIKNPYFGSEMLNCGSVEDSLDYSK
jgi:Cu(I)/Ag(I) efflux system membrane fusion protein